MSFASAAFLWLMLVVFVTYWWLPRRVQNVQLIVASLVFYGWIHPWYVLLLLYSATLDFSCGLGMGRWPHHKRVFLWMSVVGNLGLLGAFKYFDFFVANVAAALSALGLEPHLPVLEVVLPIGISFYTFQSMSYSVDVYRGKSEPCRDPLAFLLFVSFFPQLVMGPIGRARWMLPQIAAERHLTGASFRSGLSLVLWGAVKKIVVADTLSGFVFPIFAQPSPSSAMVWSASLGASIMMFADFSGYSDIARGSARLLGFELPVNFRAPYLARTPSEWWSRWHITFYEWMAEYVFNPLVLGRWPRKWLVVPFVQPTPAVHAVRGVLLTMMLAGLWHGAAWHYIVWGGFFGCIQLVYFFGGRNLPPDVRAWPHRDWVLRPLMLLVVMTSEMLFQVGDVGRVAGFLTLNPLAGALEQWLAAVVMLTVTLAGALPMVANWAVDAHLGERLTRHPAYPALLTTLWCVEGWLVTVFYRGTGSDFAYFQF